MQLYNSRHALHFGEEKLPYCQCLSVKGNDLIVIQPAVCVVYMQCKQFSVIKFILLRLCNTVTITKLHVESALNCFKWVSLYISQVEFVILKFFFFFHLPLVTNLMFIPLCYLRQWKGYTFEMCTVFIHVCLAARNILKVLHFISRKLLYKFHNTGKVASSLYWKRVRLGKEKVLVTAR